MVAQQTLYTSTNPCLNSLSHSPLPFQPVKLSTWYMINFATIALQCLSSTKNTKPSHLPKIYTKIILLQPYQTSPPCVCNILFFDLQITFCTYCPQLGVNLSFFLYSIVRSVHIGIV